LLALAWLTLCVLPVAGQSGGEIALLPAPPSPEHRSDPGGKTMPRNHPLLTGGVLLRINRRTSYPKRNWDCVEVEQQAADYL